MPAPKKRFYSARDIQTMLGISRSKANQIMHHFERQGQLYRDGRLMRVKIEDFEQWLKKARSQSSKGGTNDAADSSCKAFQ